MLRRAFSPARIGPFPHVYVGDIGSKIRAFRNNKGIFYDSSHHHLFKKGQLALQALMR